MSASLSASDVNHAQWSRGLAAFAYRNASDLYPAESQMLEALGETLAGARFLDIGVGTGRTTGHLAGRVADYVGIDYSPAMIERARERFPVADLRVMDARDLAGLDSGSFDIALFSFNGIDYVSPADRHRVLGAVRRVLKVGGAFLFSSHNREIEVPAAADLANLKVSSNPIRLAKNLAGFGLGILNSSKLKAGEIDTFDYALRNDSANRYSLLTYYIRLADQIRQLESAGFGAIEAFGIEGERLDPKQPYATGFMIHYMARKL